MIVLKVMVIECDVKAAPACTVRRGIERSDERNDVIHLSLAHAIWDGKTARREASPARRRASGDDVPPHADAPLAASRADPQPSDTRMRRGRKRNKKKKKRIGRRRTSAQC